MSNASFLLERGAALRLDSARHTRAVEPKPTLQFKSDHFREDCTQVARKSFLKNVDRDRSEARAEIDYGALIRRELRSGSDLLEARA